MKKIFESDLNGWGECATKVHVYALDDTDEYWDIAEMSFNDRCEHFGIREDYYVSPGAEYYRYDFDLRSTHIIMYETVSLNV